MRVYERARSKPAYRAGQRTSGIVRAVAHLPARNVMMEGTLGSVMAAVFAVLVDENAASAQIEEVLSMETLTMLPEIDHALAALAIWCDIRDASDEQTFTLGDAIHVSAGFEALPVQEQIGLVGHHILHVTLRHERDKQVMHDRFGIALRQDINNFDADTIVNECLTRGGDALPRPAVP